MQTSLCTVRAMALAFTLGFGCLATSCSSEPVDLSSLEEQIEALQEEIEALQEQLENLPDNSAEIEALMEQIRALQEAMDALNAPDPLLGSNATQGPNELPEDSAQVWRFAVFPDTQGRDDDNMRMYVNVTCDGATLPVSEYVGVDFNGDGFYDAGTESQNDAVKPGDWDEDGISYLVNVEDPFLPCIETDEDGAPVVVDPVDRKDYGPDWKILPVPLVEAITDRMIELDVDAVLSIGDITEFRAESDYVQWMDKVATPFADAGIPIFPVRGNHEIVNGRNWPAWFANQQEWERQSVNNVYNDINPYEGAEQVDFDQGRRLYEAYTGALVQDHLDAGMVTGFPGYENLVYWFIHNNTLFIGIDAYFGQLVGTGQTSTWLVLRDWLRETILANAPEVDHIIAFGHEPFSTKARPQLYSPVVYDAYLAELRAAESAVATAQAAYDAAVADGETDEVLAIRLAALEDAQSALEDLDEPQVTGNAYDVGQLGLLFLQDQTFPGLADEVLDLFAEFKVTYFSGHDHQYARSLIHTSSSFVDTPRGFTQIIAGNGSWKANVNRYGAEPDHETLLYLDNFVDTVSGGDLTNSNGDTYANVTSGLSDGISFIVVEINGRQITTQSHFVSHNLTEVDMNLGARYDYDTNSWCTRSGDFMISASTESCTELEWEIHDESTRTTDATTRIVGPDDNYYAYSRASQADGYLGSEATIIDGFNLTYDSSYAETTDQVERMRELFSMSWFVDNDATTLSDVLYVSGNHTQDGAYLVSEGDADVPLIDVDAGVLAVGMSPSLTYVNQKGRTVNNPTHVTRDGILRKGTDLEASLNPNLANGNPGGDGANWDGRYINDGLDFADAMTVVFKAPAGRDLETLTLGRFDTVLGDWVPAFAEACFVESMYSQHYSVWYRISEQHPEGGFDIGNCQQRYWGYLPSANAIWGFLHTDGRFAVIER